MIREYFKMDPLIHSGQKWDEELKKWVRVLNRPIMGKFSKEPLPIRKNGKPTPIFSPRLKKEVHPSVRIGVEMFATKLEAENWKRDKVLGRERKEKLTCEVIDVKPKFQLKKSGFSRRPAPGKGTRQFIAIVIQERPKAFLLKINNREIWFPKTACTFASFGKQRVLTISNWWAEQKNL